MKRNLILIGGYPGSGKTFIGSTIARELGVLVDKDGVTRPFTEALLSTLTGNPNDRESETYRNMVRPVEYKSILDIAFDNLMLKHNVVCAAPYLDEFTSPIWRQKMHRRAGNYSAAPIFIWVQATEATARARIITRKAGRDEWKTANWAEYLRGAPHEVPKDVPNLVVIQNDPNPSPPLHHQIDTIVGAIRAGATSEAIARKVLESTTSVEGQ